MNFRLRLVAKVVPVLLMLASTACVDSSASQSSAAGASSASPDHPLAGFWKDGHCGDDFGLLIEPAGTRLYSVSFCGPGGCFDPGTYRPNTPIIGDPDYRLVGDDVLEILTADGQFQAYSRCPGDVAPDPAGTQEEQRDRDIQLLLGRFWGNVVDSRGQPILPANEKERGTVPVSKPIAYRALDAGRISGMAQWCGQEWEPHYFALTRAARDRKMRDAQVAFVSVLHGFAQEQAARAMQGRTCDPATRSRIIAEMDRSQRQGLPAD